MGSGANTTFRQVGIATGVAVLGAVFEHHLTSSLGSAGRGVATGVVPPSLRETAANAFVTGLNQLFVITGVIAAVGAILTFLLIRSRDFQGRHGAEPGPALRSADMRAHTLSSRRPARARA